MRTKIVYLDETGDDGIQNSPTDIFVLSSLYMTTEEWQNNYDVIKGFRRSLKEKYGFHVSQEMHTKKFIRNKNPYRDYKWSDATRAEILKCFIWMMTQLSLSMVNVVIDKTNIATDSYRVLDNALKYSIQRIENDSAGDWNYILVTDQGRIVPMRKTARAIRAYNPIHSMYDIGFNNKPIRYMVEDIFEKDSRESYFIQLCDFVSYFVFCYYTNIIKNQPLNSRVAKVIDTDFITKTMNYWKDNGLFNLKASSANPYGIVIYPR